MSLWVKEEIAQLCHNHAKGSATSLGTIPDAAGHV